MAAHLGWKDRFGTGKVRLGMNRMQYTVEPGLYGVGQPDQNAPVLVTANYKLSFDHLRSSLFGLNAWIVVLDTQGINVWCAAGKGSFGTSELLARLKACRLAEVVAHRKLILPQLGAPGIAAHTVKKDSGFSVQYGPVMVRDIPAFIADNCKATERMRKKEFPFWERLFLTPMELVMAGKWFLPILFLVLLLVGVSGKLSFWANIHREWHFTLFASCAGILAGGFLTPLLLPFLPGRAFAVKGIWTGVALAVSLPFVAWYFALQPEPVVFIAWGLVVVAISSIMAMNFTGASTYTSLSGVKKEMRLAIPFQALTLLLGIGGWLAGRFWG